MDKLANIKFEQVIKKPTKPEERFIRFLETTKRPITQEAIKRYWMKYVAKDGGNGKYIDYYNFKLQRWEFKWISFTQSEKHRHANAWFDRWAGRFLRLSMINENCNFLNPCNVPQDNSP